MTVRSKKLITLLAALMAAALGWWFSRPTTLPPIADANDITKSSVVQDVAADVRSVKKDSSAGISPPVVSSWEADLQTPIVFFGLVLDQNGTPVSGATVEGEALNNFTSGTPFSTSSGTDGRFVVRATGASLRMRVAKEGYKNVGSDNKLKPSSQGFDIAKDTGRGIHVPNSTAPVIFNLYKEGKPADLEKIYGQAKLPQNGSAIAVKLSKESSAKILVSCKTEDHPYGSVAPFDWHFEMTVEGGGGILESIDQFEFEAPSSGYTQLAEIKMTKSLGKDWKSSQIKSYWLKLPDQTFARVKLRMIAGGDHFVVVEGYLNPTPGNANLEPRRK